MSNYPLPTRETSNIDSIKRVNSFQRKERTDRMEDYLEIIYELVQQKGYATSVDITECLNVSAPSVTKMMRRLDLKGYLEYEKYRGIRLTNQGKAVAENIKKRHKLLTEFFKIIGVSEDIAIQDAEGIEHHLHAETLEKLEKFLGTVNEYRS
ncbi:MAG: transcriptional regulator MntR [Candidatus Nitrosocosmicus sp.]|uniref:transcriptional regulator MntR n=1 Tax=Candidatus Nitrosocosmicus sp. FF01 TaxID=3397670 RepID=UPI0039E7BCDB